MSTPPVRKPLLPLDVALTQLLGALADRVPATELVSTFDADGRVLAQEVVSALQVPPQDNSSMDGYALRVADLAPGAVLPVSQRIAAGASGAPLEAGTVARIFTGAPIPPGADAVVMQEDCTEVPASEASGGRAAIVVNVQPQSGQWIRRKGEDVTLGHAVLRAGQRLSLIHISEPTRPY